MFRIYFQIWELITVYKHTRPIQKNLHLKDENLSCVSMLPDCFQVDLHVAHNYHTNLTNCFMTISTSWRSGGEALYIWEMCDLKFGSIWRYPGQLLHISVCNEWQLKRNISSTNAFSQCVKTYVNNRKLVYGSARLYCQCL